MSEKESYVFILNIVDYFATLPYEIISDHYFDKADSKQIKKIKEINDVFFKPLFHPIPYEYKISEKKRGTSVSHSYSKLSKENWRYWVIRFKGYNTEIQPLQIAMELLPQEILLGFMILNKDISGGMQYNLRHIYNFAMDTTYPRDKISKIYKKDMMLVSKYYTAINEAKNEQNSIWISLLRYHGLHSFPKQSDMIIIGLFSIIESLITHRPQLTESLDSITHQIHSKIALIHNRSKINLNYTNYFGNCNEDTIWKKLYNYRSKVVHGEIVNFNGDLSVLKSSTNVYQFLKSAVKMMLVQALKEPKLFLDLKKC